MTEPRPRGRALIVDDDLVLLATLLAVLEDGLDVRLARGVAEGTKALAGEEVDVLITDHELADGTGGQLLKAAAERHAGVHASLLTARSDSREVRDMQRDGVLVLFKPIDPAELRRWVDNGVAMARLARSAQRAATRRTARPPEGGAR